MRCPPRGRSRGCPVAGIGAPGRSQSGRRGIGSADREALPAVRGVPAAAREALAPVLLTVPVMEARGRRAGGHYAALGVPAGATPRSIEIAFARWRERLGAGRVEPESFRRAEAAYHVLSAPVSRASHDRQLGLTTHPAWRAAGRRSARSLSLRGVWQLSRGRPHAALRLLRLAASLSPCDPLTRSYLGLAFARTGANLHEAARHGEFAVERDPREPAFLFNLAEVYGAAGLRARAVRARALAWRAAALRFLRRPCRRV